MSDNLNLLRQAYCRPGTARGKTIHHLFPLERACDQGKTLLVKAPNKMLQLEEFDPAGLERTYRDEATGAELPVFAIFDLAGDNRVAFEISTRSTPRSGDPDSLFAHLPLEKAQTFVQKVNERRIKAEGVLGRISVMLGALLGIIPAAVYVFSHPTGIASRLAAFILVGGWAFAALLIYVIGVSLLDWRCPWQKLVISAEFDGILPREAREKARAARAYFDNLYLIVDQQHRWRSEFLADPGPRALDPLLIGELAQGNQRKFFVIDQFDLTAAEQYLAAEFATMPE